MTYRHDAYDVLQSVEKTAQKVIRGGPVSEFDMPEPLATIVQTMTSAAK